MKRLRFGTMCVFIISLLAPTVAAPAVEAEFAINLPSVVSLKFLAMKQSWFDLGRKGPSKTGPMARFVLLERKKDGL